MAARVIVCPAARRRFAAMTLVTRALIAAGLVVAATTFASARDLPFGRRVEAQRPSDQVYWNHRIRPKDSPGPKPRLEAVMPDAAIRAKVQADLDASEALAARGVTIDGPLLQAEMRRMAASSHAPDMLR